VSVASGQKSLISDDDIQLLGEGTHYRLADKLGAHPGEGGTSFGVWAPAAATVSVIGDPGGFEWLDANDSEQSVVTMFRSDGERPLLAAFNFTPMPRVGYRVGVQLPGRWRELLNSDAEAYGGGGWGNLGGPDAEVVPWHGRPYSVLLTLPALAAVFFAPEGEMRVMPMDSNPAGHAWPATAESARSGELR
jgi:1,4-alpha-glucan branching enzyme